MAFIKNSFPIEGRAILIEEAIKGVRKEAAVVTIKVDLLSMTGLVSLIFAVVFKIPSQIPFKLLRGARNRLPLNCHRQPEGRGNLYLGVRLALSSSICRTLRGHRVVANGNYHVLLVLSLLNYPIINLKILFSF